jgi:asparagine synthase (glutamine-hydrolysing)
LLSSAQVKRDGIFRPDAVSTLVKKFRNGTAIGARDNMALVGVLSTQLLVNRFINHFETVTPWNGSFTNFAHT